MDEIAATSSQSEIPLYPINVTKYVESLSDFVVGEVTFEFGDMDGSSKSDIHGNNYKDTINLESNHNKEKDITVSGPNSVNSENATKLFEERQRKFLYGRKVTSNILDDFGKVIAVKDTVIDDYILSIIKEKGKMVELTMNNTKQ